MFIKSLKNNKKFHQIENTLKDQQLKLSKISIRKHTLTNFQSQTQLKKKSKLKFIMDQSHLNTFNQIKAKKIKLINFQNQYIKSLTNKQTNIDERKQFIKQKIKGKVKEQLADLIKRSDFTHCSLTEVKIKDQLYNKSLNDVRVKGSSVQGSLKSVQRCMKMSMNQRPQYDKFQSMKQFTNKRFTSNNSLIYKKPMTALQSSNTTIQQSNQKTKGRRSLSNIIRLHNISARKTSRNIQSALDEMKVPGKKDSVQIQPWHLTEEY